MSSRYKIARKWRSSKMRRVADNTSNATMCQKFCHLLIQLSLTSSCYVLQNIKRSSSRVPSYTVTHRGLHNTWDKFIFGIIYTLSEKKTCRYSLAPNFAKCWLISKIFSPADFGSGLATSYQKFHPSSITSLYILLCEMYVLKNRMLQNWMNCHARLRQSEQLLQIFV